jgi:predicted dehydrogenase
MEAILADGTATVAALADTSAEAMHSCLGLASQATMAGGLDELLELKLDGIVIATPSALHAWQAQAALNSGTAVFCQKPLGRSAEETAMVVDAARRADRLLGVDFSYRDTRALAALHELIRSGELGDIYAADLTFHNAYGPDKPWFHEPSLAGGGCVMDLGIHLVDLALWMFGTTAVETVTSRLFSKGRPLPANPGVIEDFAVAQLALVEGQVVRLACSWNLPAGCDAVIEATFYGTAGAPVSVMSAAPFSTSPRSVSTAPAALRSCRPRTPGAAALPRPGHGVWRPIARSIRQSRRLPRLQPSWIESMDADRLVLMTADTIGGVWQYALQLSASLTRHHRLRVALATMGAPLTPAQRREAALLPGVTLHESNFALEWMEQPWDEVAKAGDWLLALEDRLRPDIVQLNQFAFGALPFKAPTFWWRTRASSHGGARCTGRSRPRNGTGIGRWCGPALRAPISLPRRRATCSCR